MPERRRLGVSNGQVDRDARLDLAEGTDPRGGEVYDQDADGPSVDGHRAFWDPYADEPHAAALLPRPRPARPRGRRPTVRRPAARRSAAMRSSAGHSAAGHSAAGQSAARRAAAGRSGAALAALVALALMSTFFAWVSVEPFWLAAGRGTSGTAIVTGCDGAGVATRCEGRFVPEGEEWTVSGVDLSGVPDDSRRGGAEVPARMLDEDARSAYTGPVWGLHLRWGLGLLLVLVCGVGIAACTGGGTGTGGRGAAAHRVSVPRVLGLVGPLLVFAGLLAGAVS